jgi:hypothetical protein
MKVLKENMLPQKSIKIIFVFIVLSGTTFLSLAQDNSQTPPVVSSSNPNIVLILADDFGYSSLNSYSVDHDLVRTPHKDRITDKALKLIGREVSISSTSLPNNLPITLKQKFTK